MQQERNRRVRSTDGLGIKDMDITKLANAECLNAGYEGGKELDRRTIEAQQKWKHLSAPELAALLIARTTNLHPANVNERAIKDLILTRLDA